MTEYIDREAFITEKREQYCRDCDRRKGMKNGKLKFCYEIGEAPCRSCGVDDALSDIEDYPAADVVEVVRCKDCGFWYVPKLANGEKLGACGWWSGNANIRATRAEDYCSRGVRKEDKA